MGAAAEAENEKVEVADETAEAADARKWLERPILPLHPSLRAVETLRASKTTRRGLSLRRGYPALVCLRLDFCIRIPAK